MSTEPIRLAVWSGPRNISTALMRAWENRSDCVVVDEPLYAYYLVASGVDHPMRDEVIASQDTDLRAVVAGLLGPVPGSRAVYYQKHMTHHLLDDTDRSWIPLLHNVLLVRDPAEVVASYRRARSEVEPVDIGLDQQLRLTGELADAGSEVPIIDAGDFLRDPEGYLRWLCDWIGLDFDEAMLSWPPGRRESDGVWAPHWYAAVEASTGFAPWQPRDIDLSAHDQRVADECRPAYESLYGRRVRL